MKSETSMIPWSAPDWMENARTWIEHELSQLGQSVSGPIEQPHSRPWSTILRVPTPEGIVFFKACADVLKHEVVITQALAQRQPGRLPVLLATDPEKGWMLMADGGTTVREAIQAAGNITHWEKLLPSYAQLQMDIAAHIEDLLNLGIPNRSLSTLPDQIDTLLKDKDALLLDQSDGISSDEYRQLVDKRERLSDLCLRLATSPVPESIHHGDFHDANIFLNDGQYVFFDWGDSSIAHPFFSLRTAFVIIEYFQGFKLGSPELAQLRDRYLEPWKAFGDHKELLSTFELAARLSPLSSALGWHRVVSSLDESLRIEYAGAVPSLLKEFLELEDQANK